MSVVQPYSFKSILILGFGSVGQGLLPLLLRHFSLQASQVTLIAADNDGAQVAAAFGLSIKVLRLDADNYAAVLAQYLQSGDLLINVSVEVASLSLLQWCQAQQVLYLDTCVEPWAGAYAAGGMAASNYMLRHEVLSQARSEPESSTTAVIAHGANPGLVSHLLKEALESLAQLRGISDWVCWASLAQQLGIKVVQLAELDSQTTDLQAAPGHFYNTWSVDGFMAEAWQGAEMGWGTHELSLPEGAQQHSVGDRSGIYLARHSAELRVRSWVPALVNQPEQPELQAWLITHHEALSIANLLTLPGEHAEQPLYRPTVYYAYSPAPIAAQSLQYWQDSGYQPPQVSQVLRDELMTGFDQLGVLLLFEAGASWEAGAYWYGSTLTLEAARQLSPYNSATSMQVVAGILGALSWMQQHPRAGVVEAEDMDHKLVMQVARPYLGEVRGQMTDWHPPGALQWSDFVLENADGSA